MRADDIVWRLRMRAAPREVFALLATDAGRASFWAERTVQQGDDLTFYFPNGAVLATRIVECRAAERFSLRYFGGSLVTFALSEKAGGTELCLRETGLTAAASRDNRPGWVSVLLNLKARADHRVDLRNHDSECTWDRGYVDN